MPSTENRRLFLPLMILIGMVAIGVNTINRAIASHQTWRLVVAVVPVILFSAAAIIVIMKYKEGHKHTEENQENHCDS